MKFILPYFIIFIVVIQLLLKRNMKSSTQMNKEYLERESKSNGVRRADISALPYITIPDDLPEITCDNVELSNAINTINSLRDQHILNLTGMTNTDLKIKYGAPNLPELMRCDDNYTIMVRALDKAGCLLVDNGYASEGVRYLEFGVYSVSDISTTYTKLAQYYKKTDQTEKINTLIRKVQNLNSIIKKSLQKRLEDIKES